MIQHIVLIQFKPSLSAAMIADIFSELHQIEGQIDGLLSIQSGQSESPEQMERGYLHGFIACFSDWDALARYQQHPDHQKLGARLVENAENGRDGILVFDLPVADRPVKE